MNFEICRLNSAKYDKYSGSKHQLYDHEGGVRLHKGSDTDDWTFFSVPPHIQLKGLRKATKIHSQEKLAEIRNECLQNMKV